MKRYIAFITLVMCVAVAVFFSGLVFPTWLAVSVLVVGIVCDSLTTWLCLRKKGTEGNPVVSFLFKKIGFVGTLVLWAIIWVAIIYFRILPASPMAQTAVAIAYWLVVVNNLIVLRRVSKAYKANMVTQVV